MDDSSTPPATPVKPDAIGHYPVEFSGDGGEYFRVWIVNVLLSIITLGLYTPWARRRTVQYFYGHTHVANGPLEFTAKVRNMVIGFVLFALLYVAFNVASETGNEPVVAILTVAWVLGVPWLWGSAMRFRLGNTRWRGLRLRFDAIWGEIYRASWPVFAAFGLWAVLGFALAVMAPDAKAKAALPKLSAPMWILVLLGLTLTFVFVVRLEYNYKLLLARRTQIGGQAGRWFPGFGAFLRIWLGTVGVFLLSALLVTGLAMLLAMLFGGAQALSERTGVMRVVFLVFFGIVAGVAGAFLAISPAMAYREARMFQLLWDNVGVSRLARFKTSLRTGAFVWLRIRNVLLTALTLGLYRPFARVNEYRMKAESTMLYLKGDMAPLVGQLMQQQQKDGLGDAMADALGLDLVG